MSHRKNKGFTLVELVVVITILAILGTIGFLSVGGYSSRSRDSARLADATSITKSLDVSIITAGNYPTPDNSFSVTYSWAAIWNQGTVGSSVLQVFKSSISGGGLNKKPVDPLRGTDYVYSSLAEGKAYQVKVDYEGDLTALNDGIFVNTAYAAPGDPTIGYIRGNYVSSMAKVSSGGILYVLAMPSIITNTGTTAGGTIPTTSLSGTLLFNGKPLKWGNSFNPNTVVHSWSKTAINPSGLPTNSGGILAMMTTLQGTYSGSDIQSYPGISTLVNTPSAGLVELGNNIVKSQLGGEAVSTWGTTNNNLVSGACTNLPANAFFYNSSASYSLAGAASGTTLNGVTAGYSASPTANTCQWKCSSGTYSAGRCVLVSATETSWTVFANAWNSKANGSTFVLKWSTMYWELKKVADAGVSWTGAGTYYARLYNEGRFSLDNGSTWSTWQTLYGASQTTQHFCPSNAIHGWCIYDYGWGCTSGQVTALANGTLCNGASTTTSDWTME